MYSINPFVFDYSRPKSSYDVFDDLYHPFSSNYMREQPSLFRSSSFRYPNYYQSLNERCRQKSEESSEPEDEFDPFRELFGLRKAKESKPQSKGSENLRSSNESIKSSLENSKQQKGQTKSSIQETYLDSTRFDTDNEIEYRFTNYKCNDPSGISVKITKDNYIELKTSDNYIWKNRIPDDAGDITKASCTLVKGRLILRLPKKMVASQPEKNEVKNDPVKNNATKTENEQVKYDQINKSTDVNQQDKVDDEFDPDAPIVEDIYEDEGMN